MSWYRILVFSFVIINTSCLYEYDTDRRSASPLFHVTNLCSRETKILHQKKIICLLCKLFDPSCLGPENTTATVTTEKSSTNTPTLITTSSYFDTSSRPTTSSALPTSIKPTEKTETTSETTKEGEEASDKEEK